MTPHRRSSSTPSRTTRGTPTRRAPRRSTPRSRPPAHRQLGRSSSARSALWPARPTRSIASVSALPPVSVGGRALSPAPVGRRCLAHAPAVCRGIGGRRAHRLPVVGTAERDARRWARRAVHAMVDRSWPSWRLTASISHAEAPYDFARAFRLALREYAPEVVLLPGPGASLGTACAQLIVAEGYRGIRSRTEFEAVQARSRPDPAVDASMRSRRIELRSPLDLAEHPRTTGSRPRRPDDPAGRAVKPGWRFARRRDRPRSTSRSTGRRSSGPVPGVLAPPARSPARRRSSARRTARRTSWRTTRSCEGSSAATPGCGCHGRDGCCTRWSRRSSSRRSPAPRRSARTPPSFAPMASPRRSRVQACSCRPIRPCWRGFRTTPSTRWASSAGGPRSIRRAAARATWLESSSDAAEASRRLTSLPGIGPWTAAEVVRSAFGDPDAVSVGDYHIPNSVAWALAGEPRANDARMLELLEPYRGQRGRVQRYLEVGRVAAPRYGPRMAPRRIAAI